MGRNNKRIPREAFWPSFASNSPVGCSLDHKYHDEIEHQLLSMSWDNRGVFVALMEYHRLRIRCRTDKEAHRKRSNVIMVCSRMLDLPDGWVLRTSHDRKNQWVYAWLTNVEED